MFQRFALLLWLLLAVAIPAGAADPYSTYMAAEQSNDYQASDTTVKAEYRSGEEFDLRYLAIPEDRLNLATASELSSSQQAHLYFEKEGRKYVRFFIHPDSEHLYEPLIREYGWAGAYRVSPTSSTRTVLARDPLRPDLPRVFLKPSLAQKQDQLGRIVPGWEVRRSVGITEAYRADAKLRTPNVEIIPEFAGAYVKAAEGLGFDVDKDQGKVFEHGFLMRDASFIEKEEMVRPLFWFFSHNGAGEPPVISLWKKSGEPDFHKFVVDRFFEPFIKMNLPLMLNEGIVPQIHGQNVLVSLDPESLEIKKIFHRDVGSMKADYRLRWISGLPIDPLHSPLADKDFGLSWGAERVQRYHVDYLHDWLVRWGYLKGIRKHVPKYDPGKSEKLLLKVLDAEVAKQLGLKPGKNTDELVADYISKNPPADLGELKPLKGADLLPYIESRKKLNQVVSLPASWSKEIAKKIGPGEKLYSEYGIIFASTKGGSNYQIAFFDSSNAKAQFKARALPKASAKAKGKPDSPACPAAYRALSP